MTYNNYLQLAKTINSKNEKINKLILLFLIKKDLSWLYANLNQNITVDFLNSYLELIKKYAAGYPFQYIIGYEWFYGHKLMVNSSVLIPRSETELLVENVFAYAQTIFNHNQLTVLDLGTGSGAIAISLALQKPQWKIVASDISNDALQVAKINGQNYQLNNINFIASNLFANIAAQKFDIIVANPPYIDQKSNTFLVKNLQHEPATALFAPNKGLYFYELIFQQCHSFLQQKFLLALEFGFDQKPQLTKLVKTYFSQCHSEFVQDNNGHWRMLFIWR